MTQGILLHALGDPDAGERWRSALMGAPDGTAWTAPDLPGHGATPAPRNGAYDPMAAVTVARRVLAEQDDDPPVVVGVGENAHAAVLLGAAGACAAVVVVDGLHGPFRTPADEVRTMYATIRALAADPGATGPPPAGGLDPRTTHGYGLSVSPTFLRRLWGAISVPVLAVETPRSPTPPEEREPRIGWFGGPAGLVTVDDGSARSVVAAIASWSVSVGLAGP